MLELKPAHLMPSIPSRNRLMETLAHMITNRVPIDQFSLMKLIDATLSARGFGPPCFLFTQFQHSIDSDLCNSVIQRYNGLKKYVHSVFVYTQMHQIGIYPKYSTFPSVIKAVAQLSYGLLGQWIHCCMIKKGLDSAIHVGTALAGMYFSCFLARDARKVFDQMPERTPISWNALLTGYTHNRMFREAIDAFREMQNEGAEPDEVTVVEALSACGHLGALNQGKWIHDYIKHNKLTLNLIVGTGLIDMYAKCGVVDKAENVFREIRKKDKYAWNVLIFGYALNGQGESALKSFNRMIVEDVKPDHLTFLAVLCACCHQGLADEGRRFFKTMQDDFGLQPRIQHYGCMVDLLGRAGFLHEAQELIHKMRMKPDPIIWRAFTGACRIHKNTHLGEFAVKKLLELEPNNGQNYVLLSNLYSQDRRWVQVEKVRKVMDLRGIRKVPGCSSIEIGNLVYEFVASDINKPGLEDVYRHLVDINKEMKVFGYVADTDMALCDVEEEEKERSLMYHSEKISLAFGLLKSPANSSLRIIKNLRVCQDCHGFFKVVSKVYSRDISLRDRNRFHHFVGGACSCNDFW